MRWKPHSSCKEYRKISFVTEFVFVIWIIVCGTLYIPVHAIGTEYVYPLVIFSGVSILILAVGLGCAFAVSSRKIKLFAAEAGKGEFDPKQANKKMKKRTIIDFGASSAIVVVFALIWYLILQK